MLIVVNGIIGIAHGWPRLEMNCRLDVTVRRKIFCQHQYFLEWNLSSNDEDSSLQYIRNSATNNNYL
jgi:hypothetical protein